LGKKIECLRHHTTSKKIPLLFAAPSCVHCYGQLLQRQEPNEPLLPSPSRLLLPAPQHCAQLHWRFRWRQACLAVQAALDLVQLLVKLAVHDVPGERLQRPALHSALLEVAVDTQLNFRQIVRKFVETFLHSALADAFPGAAN
jgi:hypothetical protein